MSYIPPHLRGKKLAAPVNTTRRVRFIGNALGISNVETNKEVRFAPRGNAVAGKKTLKSVHKRTPDLVPQKPGHALRNAAPKFSKMALNHLGYAAWRKTKKARKPKKGTRKHKK